MNETFSILFQEAWLNTLVATEVICWFFIGECIGKGSLVAYKVWSGPLSVSVDCVEEWGGNKTFKMNRIRIDNC